MPTVVNLFVGYRVVRYRSLHVERLWCLLALLHLQVDQLHKSNEVYSNAKQHRNVAFGLEWLMLDATLRSGCKVSTVQRKADFTARTTNIKRLYLATIVTNSLQDLFDLGHKTVVVDRCSKLDDTKMSRTLDHVLFASLTLEVSIDRTEMRIVWTLFARS